MSQIVSPAVLCRLQVRSGRGNRRRIGGGLNNYRVIGITPFQLQTLLFKGEMRGGGQCCRFT